MSGLPQQPQQQEQQQGGGFHIQTCNNVSNLRSFGANISIARQSVSFGDGISQENMQKVLDALNRRNDAGSSITAFSNVEDLDFCETTMTLTDRKIDLPAQPNSDSTAASQASHSEGVEGGERASPEVHQETIRDNEQAAESAA